jgi:hypothetical protein
LSTPDSLSDWLDLTPARTPATHTGPVQGTVTGIVDQAAGLVEVTPHGAPPGTSVVVPSTAGITWQGAPVRLDRDTTGAATLAHAPTVTAPTGVVTVPVGEAAKAARDAAAQANAALQGAQLAIEETRDDLTRKIAEAASAPIDGSRIKAGTVTAREIVASEALYSKLAAFDTLTVVDKIRAENAVIPGELIADRITGKWISGAQLRGSEFVLGGIGTPHIVRGDTMMRWQAAFTIGRVSGQNPATRATWQDAHPVFDIANPAWVPEHVETTSTPTTGKTVRDLRVTLGLQAPAGATVTATYMIGGEPAVSSTSTSQATSRTLTLNVGDLEATDDRQIRVTATWPPAAPEAGRQWPIHLTLTRWDEAYSDPVPSRISMIRTNQNVQIQLADGTGNDTVLTPSGLAYWQTIGGRRTLVSELPWAALADKPALCWASGEVESVVFNGDVWNRLQLMSGGRKLVETGGAWKTSDGGQTVTVPKAGVYQVEAWAAIKSYSWDGTVLLAVTNAAKGTVYSPTSAFGSVYAYGAAGPNQYMTIRTSGMIRCGEGERIGIALLSNQAAYATLKDYRFTATYLRQ